MKKIYEISCSEYKYDRPYIRTTVIHTTTLEKAINVITALEGNTLYNCTLIKRDIEKFGYFDGRKFGSGRYIYGDYKFYTIRKRMLA